MNITDYVNHVENTADTFTIETLNLKDETQGTWSDDMSISVGLDPWGVDAASVFDIANFNLDDIK